MLLEEVSGGGGRSWGCPPGGSKARTRPGQGSQLSQVENMAPAQVWRRDKPRASSGGGSEGHRVEAWSGPPGSQRMAIRQGADVPRGRAGLAASSSRRASPWCVAGENSCFHVTSTDPQAGPGRGCGGFRITGEGLRLGAWRSFSQSPRLVPQSQEHGWQVSGPEKSGWVGLFWSRRLRVLPIGRRLHAYSEPSSERGGGGPRSCRPFQMRMCAHLP